MSTDDNLSFMPPDEPTAVYPIGQASIDVPPVEAPEPPEPPELTTEPPPAATPEGGFNPVLAVALITIPIVMGIGAVLLAGILVSLK